MSAAPQLVGPAWTIVGASIVHRSGWLAPAHGEAIAAGMMPQHVARLFPGDAEAFADIWAMISIQSSKSGRRRT